MIALIINNNLTLPTVYDTNIIVKNETVLSSIFLAEADICPNFAYHMYEQQLLATLYLVVLLDDG